MARRLSLLLPLVLVVFTACGKEIGDSCSFGTDCSPNADRICIDPTSGHGGYCTVQGCDYSTCPDEAACVRFFTGDFSNEACATPGSGDPECSLDELCALNQHCVPRSAEVRYCMRKCDSDGDCRGGYECRTFQKMIEHGGEAVLAPGTPLDEAHSPKFCAVAPAST